MSVTLKAIAEKAKVSISTVSRVVNNDPTKPASQETIDRIWEIVREMGYIPNQHARNLIKGNDSQEEKITKKTIGCLYTSTLDTNNDPFFSYIGLGVQEELKRQGYVMAYALSIYGMDFSEIYNYVLANPVEGVVVLGRFDQDTLEFLKKHYTNIIYAGVNSVNGGFDEVICDGYKGAKAALNHLKDLGHEKIGFVGYAQKDSGSKLIINEHRYKAYVDFLDEQGWHLTKNNIVHTSLKSTEAYENMMAYLKGQTKETLPTAFYCANDVTAIGAMKAIKEHGLKIPEDISIVGLDDIEMASFVSPALTTVHIKKEELGRTAVKILVDKIESNRTYPYRVDLPFELVVRHSTKSRP